jgi:hypothetical protein
MLNFKNSITNLFNFGQLQRTVAILVPKTATLICGSSALTIEDNPAIYGRLELHRPAAASNSCLRPERRDLATVACDMERVKGAGLIMLISFNLSPGFFLQQFVYVKNKKTIKTKRDILLQKKST